MAKLVEIAQFYDPEEAYCAKGYLRSFGIESIIQNEHHLSVSPALRIALGGFRLLAMSDEMDDARSALDQVRKSPQFGDNDGAVQSNPPHEPPLRKTNWGWLPLAFVSGVPFVPLYRNREALLWQSILLIIPFYLAAFGSYAWWFGFLD